MKIRDYTVVKTAKGAWDRNPLLVVAITSGAMVAISKGLEAMNGFHSKSVHAPEKPATSPKSSGGSKKN